MTTQNSPQTAPAITCTQCGKLVKQSMYSEPEVAALYTADGVEAPTMDTCNECAEKLLSILEGEDGQMLDPMEELGELINGQSEDSRSSPHNDDFLDLDDLLKESVASVEADRNLARSRKLLQRKDLPAFEREDLEARVAEWEARKYWETLAHVAVFHKQRCACGAVHQHFSHMMYHQQHRTDRFCQRWVRATAFVDTQTRMEVAVLPNKVAFQNCVVPICHECAGAAGFDLNAKDSLNWEIIQLSQEV